MRCVFLVVLEDSFTDVRNPLPCVRLSCYVELSYRLAHQSPVSPRTHALCGTYLGVLVFWKDLEEVFQECNHLLSHFVHLVYVAVGVDVAETRAYRLIHEQDVCKLIPAAVLKP